MKYNLFTIAILLFAGLMTSCDNPRITGSDDVTVETRDLTDFTDIEVHDVINIHVTNGFEYAVEVHSNENIQSRIRTVVDNGILDISLENGNYSDITAEVFIVLPNPERVTVRDAASGVVSGLLGADIHLEVHDSGDLEAFGFTDKLQLEVHDAGDFDGFGLTSVNCALLVKDAGNADITVTNFLEGVISDAGEVRYKGNATVDVEIRDAGDLDRVN